MYTAPLRRLLPAIALLASLFLSSCGGGSSSAGVGGSGVGGTGITTVTGNVSQVVAEAPGDQTLGRRMVAAVTNFLSRPVNAQSTMLGDIQVVGGGKITTTDASGNFTLEEVTPNQNFILSFTLSDDQTIALPIGEVPAGTTVRVNDVVLDTNQGFASAGDVEVEENDEDSQEDGDSTDDGNSGEDGTSQDGASQDDDGDDDDDNGNDD